MDIPNCSSNMNLEELQEEMIAKTVAQQAAKVRAYDLLKAKGLPVPLDLKAEIEANEGGN
jgi:hypothetical protein